MEFYKNKLVKTINGTLQKLIDGYINIYILIYIY